MDLYSRLGVPTYINAHDTYTVYGGSRMSGETRAAMAEAAEQFVDMAELQRILGERIARLTRNEGAYITNGAAGGLLLAAAVCMAGGDIHRYTRLPDTSGMPNEIIVMRGQRNAYDAAVRASGAEIVEIGDADETPEYELEGAISERTAALFYFAPSTFARASMPLERAVEICHSRGIPVVVDAAAQLPPAENLWRYTGLGADLVLFSGGKTLAGPQDSGLLLGRRELVEHCIRFGAPAHGICRSSKTSREAMAGLYSALEQFLQTDWQAVDRQYQDTCQTIRTALEQGGISARIVPHGSVGQTYPRVFGDCRSAAQAWAIQAAMRARHIYIGVEAHLPAITFSPQNLRPEELAAVTAALQAVLAEHGGEEAPHA